MSKRGRPPYPDCLTPGEWRVVEGVRHGLTNPAIAARCGITADAVKFHVSSVLGKLGFNSRHQLRQWDGVRADSALTASIGDKASIDWSLAQIARTARDVDAMAIWFRDIVGLPEVLRFPGMAFFDCGGVRLYLSESDGGANSILYFRVADIQAEVARLRAADVVFKTAPHLVHTHPDGTEEWMAFFSDLEGHALAVTSSVRRNEEDKS